MYQPSIFPRPAGGPFLPTFAAGCQTSWDVKSREAGHGDTPGLGQLVLGKTQ